MIDKTNKPKEPEDFDDFKIVGSGSKKPEEIKQAVKEEVKSQEVKSQESESKSEKSENEKSENEKSDQSQDSNDDKRVLLSTADAFVYDRMKAQPKTLEDVELKITGNDKDPNYHQLILPSEIKAYENKFVFRWLNKSKRALDYSCDVRGWILVNRTYFPDLPRHMFTVQGSIERGDCILAFIPKKLAEEIRKEPQERSKEMVDSLFNKHANDPNYYNPQGDDRGEKVVMI